MDSLQKNSTKKFFKILTAEFRLLAIQKLTNFSEKKFQKGATQKDETRKKIGRNGIET